MNSEGQGRTVENKASGGWGGIRTHGALASPPVFKTGAFNRSATHPEPHDLLDLRKPCKAAACSSAVLLPGVLQRARCCTMGCRAEGMPCHMNGSCFQWGRSR